MVHRSNIYHSKIYQKGNWKKNMQFSLNEKVPRSTIHFERWARYLRHRHSIKVFKNKVDLNIVKFHLCSLQGSHAVPVEINLNSNQALVRFRLKRSLDLIDRKIWKKTEQWRFLYSITQYFATFHQKQLSYFHIYRRNYWPTHIFKTTHQTGL